jgi:hypothetical protein
VSLICLKLGAVGAQSTQPRPAGTNAFELVLNCESNLTYAIQTSTNLTSWTTRTRSKGTETARRINIDFGSSNFPTHAFFRALQINDPMFAFSLAARESIDLGDNVRIDSFDSGDPRYSTGGKYDPSKARDGGDIATESSEANAISIGNSKVHGRVHTGNGGSVMVGPDGIVGDHGFVANPINGGKIQAGWFTDDAADLFSDVVVPSYEYLPLPPATNDAATGLNAHVLASGTYRTPTLTGTIVITGSVRILVDDVLYLTGQDMIYLNTNATLAIYMDGTNALIGGRGIINPHNATNFSYFGTPRNVDLIIGGNAITLGIFYAPNADVKLAGGGGFSNDLIGCMVAKSIQLLSRFSIHFDEALLRNGPWR